MNIERLGTPLTCVIAPHPEDPRRLYVTQLPCDLPRGTQLLVVPLSPDDNRTWRIAAAATRSNWTFIDDTRGCADLSEVPAGSRVYFYPEKGSLAADWNELHTRLRAYEGESTDTPYEQIMHLKVEYGRKAKAAAQRTDYQYARTCQIKATALDEALKILRYWSEPAVVVGSDEWPEGGAEKWAVGLTGKLGGDDE